MSLKTSHIPMMAQPDGSGGGSPRTRSTKSARAEVEPGEGTLGPVPPPLPSDPKVRAELFARLDKGIAEARAGRGEDWEVVHARIFGPDSTR